MDSGGGYNVCMTATSDRCLPISVVAPVTALVLAGRRLSHDPLAQAKGHSHKARLVVDGMPLIVRVLASLRAASSVGNIVVSTDDATLLSDVDAAAGVELHASQPSPAASVLDYLRTHPESGAVCVTTADHALLSADMVEYFCAAADRSEADVVVGVITADVFRAQYIESRRTFFSLKGERVCGANLFLLRTPRAIRAVRFWERAGRFRKRPWRLVSLFGFGNLLRFVCGRLDRQTAIDRTSRVLGARVGVVDLPFAAAAIDVDTLHDLATVERILATRKSAPR